MTYDSNFEIRNAQIAALGGETGKKYDSEYSQNLELLRLMQGGLGAKIDDLNTSTGTVWSSAKTEAEIEEMSASGDIVHYTVGQTWTQEDADEFTRIYTTYGVDDMFAHMYFKSDNSNIYYRCMAFSPSTAMYAECYGGQLIMTAINMNVAVGGTLSVMKRYYYSPDDFFVLEEGVTVTSAMTYKFGTLDVSTAMNTLYAKATFDGDTVYMRLVSIDTTLAPRKYTFAAIVGEFGQNLYQCEIQTITTGDPITFIHKCKIPFTKIDDANKWTTLTWSSNKIYNELSGKQASLVSGTNIKTINNQSLLGSGDITIAGAAPIIMTEGGTMTAELRTSLTALSDDEWAERVYVNSSNGTFRCATYEDGTMIWFDSNVGRIFIKSASSFPCAVGETITFTSYGVARLSEVNAKQDTLVSGTNIKTINNQSLLGSGNITIQGGGGGAAVTELTQAQYDALTTIDPTMIYNITDATPTVMNDYTPLTSYNTLVASLPTTYNPYNTTNAQSAGYLPSWNARGQITGTGNYMYQSSGTINGTSQTFYRTTSAALPGIYAAVTSGTSGQVLQSRGANQAPVWVDYRSDATDYINYNDVSNGTYSTGISTFYQNCISLGKIGPMQMVRDIDHLLPVNGDPISGSLTAGTKVCNENNEAVHLTYTDGSQVEHNITLNADGTVTDPDATGAVTADPSTVITGYNAYNVVNTCSIVDGTPYEVDYETFTSHSYYLPSSTRLFEGNIEVWFFTTEDGVTWKNMHVTITDSTVSQTTTTGTFGA